VKSVSHKALWGLTALLALAGREVFPAHVVTTIPKPVCEKIDLGRDRELTVYKDPNIFLPNLAMLYQDPTRGANALRREDPVMRREEGGTLWIERLGEPHPFPNFGAISRLYGLRDPRLMPPNGGAVLLPGQGPTNIVSVRLCGRDAYQDGLGFVVLEDLEFARKDQFVTSGMPPSIEPNPIPKWPRAASASAVP